MTKEEAVDKVVDTINHRKMVPDTELHIHVPLAVIQSGLLPDALDDAVSRKQITKVTYTFADSSVSIYLPKETRVNVS